MFLPLQEYQLHSPYCAIWASPPPPPPPLPLGLCPAVVRRPWCWHLGSFYWHRIALGCRFKIYISRFSLRKLNIYCKRAFIRYLIHFVLYWDFHRRALLLAQVQHWTDEGMRTIQSASRGEIIHLLTREVEEAEVGVWFWLCEFISHLKRGCEIEKWMFEL